MNDQTKSMMYFGFEPNLYIKINEFTFGVDKKMLSTYSDVFSTLLDDMDEDDHFLDLSSDSSIIPQAFNIVMMFYYTPSWCEFKFTNEHYKIIWQIVYICNKFNFSKIEPVRSARFKNFVITKELQGTVVLFAFIPAGDVFDLFDFIENYLNGIDIK